MQEPAKRRLGVMELTRKRGRGQVTGDQEMIRFKAPDPLDEVRDPLEPKPTPAPEKKRGGPQKPLAHEPERVKRIPPEVNVRKVNDAHVFC